MCVFLVLGGAAWNPLRPISICLMFATLFRKICISAMLNLPKRLVMLNWTERRLDVRVVSRYVFR